ncbi:MAG: nucleotidyltransferase family protein [candidate division WOR-3 bacterium]|nr:nucleotidyltransferase family protein [candidate division WOR-3 bacterium]
MSPPRSTADLLLLCLSDGRQPSAVSRQPSTDWNEVANMAVRHGLAPLLFKRLKQSGAQAGIPADAWERLRLAYFNSAGRNKRRFRELRTVLGCLRTAGIPVIVLKGAYLAEAVYGDIAVRPMCDVDLMVPRAEVPRTQAVLLDMGRVQRHTEDVEWWYRNECHLPAVIIRTLAVEVHWTIIPADAPLSIDTAGIWDRACTASVAGVDVLALSLEDLLLHLCLHSACREGFGGGLRPYSDIAETIRRHGGVVDWPRVAGLAREWDAARYVGLALHLAKSMLGAEVPDDVLERLVPGGIDRRILEAARESVLVQTDYRHVVSFMDRWGAMSFRDKPELLWRRVFLSFKAMVARYAASQGARHLSRYYVLRLRDIIRTLAAQFMRRGRATTRIPAQDRNASLANWLESSKPVRQGKDRAKVRAEAEAKVKEETQ